MSEPKFKVGDKVYWTYKSKFGVVTFCHYSKCHQNSLGECFYSVKFDDKQIEISESYLTAVPQEKEVKE